jgi:hypothetical protein
MHGFIFVLLSTFEAFELFAASMLGIGNLAPVMGKGFIMPAYKMYKPDEKDEKVIGREKDDFQLFNGDREREREREREGSQWYPSARSLQDDVQMTFNCSQSTYSDTSSILNFATSNSSSI